MGKYFGTDGIRGAYGDGCINPNFAYRMGAALGARLEGGRVYIGRDTRASGTLLVNALVAGLQRHSAVSVVDLGIVPTPAVARALLDADGSLGIAVTASHNPASDNGIKLFDAQGCKLSPHAEAAIESAIDAEAEFEGTFVDTDCEVLDGSKQYVAAVSKLFEGLSLSGLKLVLDTANGATCITTPVVFEALGASVHLLGNTPDGTNINDGVGSEYPEALGRAVLAEGAALGIAHDGDGDRLVICDAKGKILDGDCLLGILALQALEEGRLGSETLVTTVQSNLGLDRALEAAGAQIERTDVGDRNVAAKMRAIGASVGGENSGHIILSDYASTGDGLLAALELIQIMQRTGKSLSELSNWVTLFPQATANMRVAVKTPLPQLPSVTKAVASLEEDFGKAGRVMLRYSGTEPKLRLLVEGENEARVEAAMKILKVAVQKDLEIIL